MTNISTRHRKLEIGNRKAPKNFDDALRGDDKEILVTHFKSFSSNEIRLVKSPRTLANAFGIDDNIMVSLFMVIIMMITIMFFAFVYILELDICTYYLLLHRSQGNRNFS